MKKAIDRMWSDILQGKNITTYTVIFFAFLIPTLNTLGLLSNDWLQKLMMPLLGLLLSDAVAKGWMLRDIQFGSRAYPIRVHKRWGDSNVYNAIESATKSIVIITSWVVDPPIITDHIQAAYKNRSSPLKVQVYMLDPALPFGAQRYYEIYEKDIEEARKQFNANFDACITSFKTVFRNEQKIEIEIFKYSTMPFLKLYVIDGSEYFFSWFPASTHATTNICLHLSQSQATDESQQVIENLKVQIQKLRERSVKIDW